MFSHRIVVAGASAQVRRSAYIISSCHRRPQASLQPLPATIRRADAATSSFHVGHVRPTAAATSTTAAASSASQSSSSSSSNNGNNKIGSKDDKIEELFQKILWLDMFEVHILTELLNEKMGLGDLNQIMASGPASSSTTGADAAKDKAAAAEEKTLFDLKLVGFDAKAKIKVIKEVRAIAGLGLKEAKELVEGAPKVVKKDIKKEEAEELQKKLEEVGATIEVV